jgi:WD40 repeat protein
MSVSFSPDGSLLASNDQGTFDGEVIKLWDVGNQTQLASLAGHTSSVDSVSFSPDGRLLASGSNDNTIKLWDIENQTEITSLTGHVGRVDSVSFSPDGSLLASGSGEWSDVSDTLDKTVKTWDLSDFYNRAVIDSAEYVGDYGPNIYDQAQPGTSDSSDPHGTSGPASVNQHGPSDNSRGHWRVQIGADNDINSQHEFSLTNATANGLDLEDDNALSVDNARTAITAMLAQASAISQNVLGLLS